MFLWPRMRGWLVRVFNQMVWSEVTGDGDLGVVSVMWIEQAGGSLPYRTWHIKIDKSMPHRKTAVMFYHA